MALTFGELDAITNDYFAADGKKAVDIYFNDCFAMDYTMKKQKGMWERPNGGDYIRIPLSYDGQEGGFYSRNSTLSSDDKTSLNAARYNWKHAYGNATVYRTDELKNAGEYAEVQLVTSKLEGAQKTVRKKIAQQIYSQALDGAEELSGLLACCVGNGSTVAYGNIAQDDLVASDGTKPWTATNTTTTEAISLAVIRTLRSSAKIGDGAKGKPNVGFTTETLFNIVSGILQAQQRFQTDSETVKAGFTHVVFEGMILAADDYCTSGYLYLVNLGFWGWAVHKQGYFARTPWGDLLVTGTVAKSMKIFWDGNIICSNRKAHAAHSNLS